MSERRIGQTRIKKEKLLAKLKENLAKHKQEYEEGVAGYRQQVSFELNQLTRKWSESNQLDLSKLVSLPKPENYSGQYEIAIAMLENGEDDEIILDAEDFKQYFLDDWHWTRQFKDVASNYASNLKR